MFFRTTTPLPGGEGTFKINTWLSASTVRPVGISKDRTLLYGAGSTGNATLQQSSDEGVTWNTVKVLANTIMFLLELDDGEALAFVNTSGKGSVYRSTGWTTSHTTATWALVLTSAGGYFNGFGLNAASFGDENLVVGTGQYGVIAAYGAQTSNAGDQTTKGRYVYFTSDYGATWGQVFDLYSWTGNAIGMHVHGASYDPYWDRLWVTWGDTQKNSKTDVVYSDDHGATWVQVPAASVWAASGSSSTNALQCTTVLPRPECILFGSDPAQGMWMIRRTGYRTMSKPTIVFMNATGSGSTTIAMNTSSLRGFKGAPVIHTWSSEKNLMQPGIAASWDDGFSWHNLWMYPFATPSSAVGTAYGPTAKGTVILGCYDSGAVYYIITGELIKPEEGITLLRLNATGDGVTTAFNVPHYQGRTPASTSAHAQSSAALATNTVTSNATNTTITFSVAPANLAIVQMTIRIRP